MPNTIVFEELDAAPPESLEGLAEVPVAGAGLVAAAGDWIFGFGAVQVAQANVGAAVEDVEVIIGFAEIPSSAAYSLVMEVDECEGFGEVSVAGAATTETSLVLGLAEVPVAGAAVIGLELIPVGDEPEQDVQDGLVAVSAVSYDEILAVLSGLMGTADATATANRMVSSFESLSLSDRLRLLLEAVVTDTAAFEEAVAGDPVITTALVDALQLTGQVQGSVAAMALLSDLLALHEYLASVHDDEIEDAAAVTDTIEGLARVMEVIVTDLTFGDTATGMGVFTVLATEDVVLADEVDTATIRLALVSENMRLAVSLSIDGEPYVGLSMHAATRAITEYAGYEYNSLAWFRGKLYGAAETGLLRLEGADDNGAPVLAHVRTAMQRIAGGRAARIQEAFIGFRADGSMQLKVTVPNASGDRISYVYDIDRTPHGGQQVGRFKVGRGIKTVYASFELANGVAGGDFAVDVLEIHPLVLERRLP